MLAEQPLRYVTRGPENKTVLLAHALAQGNSDRPLSLCTDNRPPAEGPYVCIVAVLDYWRMNSALARSRDAWHYSTGIDPQILSDIRSRRCALIFDLCNEGMPYDSEIFDELFSWIATNQLPAKQVVWLDQNRNMEASCRLKVRSESELIQFAHYDFFIKRIAFLFSVSSARDIVGSDPELFIKGMFDQASKDKLLLCLNATPKLWRVITLGALVHHDLLNSSLISFPGMRSAKGSESPDRVRRHVEARSPLKYLMPGIEAAMQLSNLRVDAFSETGNALYERIDARPYQRTFFSIVTETDFTDGSVARVTEKIAKPFCLGHPGIVVGNPQSVRFMTELGFADCDSVIDRSYESEHDPVIRFGLVLGEILRQAHEIRRDPDSWLRSVRDAGVANIRHSVSGQFLAQYIKLYDRPLVTKLQEMVRAST